jgi:hypothetical protein
LKFAPIIEEENWDETTSVIYTGNGKLKEYLYNFRIEDPSFTERDFIKVSDSSN